MLGCSTEPHEFTFIHNPPQGFSDKSLRHPYVACTDIYPLSRMLLLALSYQKLVMIYGRDCQFSSQCLLSFFLKKHSDVYWIVTQPDTFFLFFLSVSCATPGTHSQGTAASSSSLVPLPGTQIDH